MNDFSANLDWDALLAPYLCGTSLEDRLQRQLNQYLTVLLQWNARISLTSIREPSEIIRRHFGESLFAAKHLRATGKLLDFGTGAGFPGIPIQLLHLEQSVTLAESNAKKVSFLREITRYFALQTQIYCGRVEQMPATELYDVITLRAVEKMPEAILTAARHVAPSGTLLAMTTVDAAATYAATVHGFTWHPTVLMPESDTRVLLLGTRLTS
jgi:16S rRNA (guanine527-N7)-methyltransferase